MVSDTELPEVTEQLNRLMAMEDRRRRIAWAIVAAVISVITTVIGIYVIGQQVAALGMGIQGDLDVLNVWHPFQLECGIFVTLVGTILMAISFNFLIASWKK